MCIQVRIVGLAPHCSALLGQNSCGKGLQWKASEIHLGFHFAISGTPSACNLSKISCRMILSWRQKHSNSTPFKHRPFNKCLCSHLIRPCAATTVETALKRAIAGNVPSPLAWHPTGHRGSKVTHSELRKHHLGPDKHPSFKTWSNCFTCFKWPRIRTFVFLPLEIPWFWGSLTWQALLGRLCHLLTRALTSWAVIWRVGRSSTHMAVPEQLSSQVRTRPNHQISQHLISVLWKNLLSHPPPTVYSTCLQITDLLVYHSNSWSVI